MKWKKGEVKDVSDDIVDKLAQNEDFKVIGKNPIKKEKKVIKADIIEEDLITEEFIEENKNKEEYD